jgi:hypothetical protein
VVALALYGARAAYADGVHWIRAAPDDWITSASLSFARAGIILHVGIGLRWQSAAAARKLSSLSTEFLIEEGVFSAVQQAGNSRVAAEGGTSRGSR